MDLLWFLQRRLRFINNLYDGGTNQFRETVRQIDANEPPFVDDRNPERDDVSEPRFLAQYQDTVESIEVVGHWCLCMVYAALKAYLERYTREIARDFPQAFGNLPNLFQQKVQELA